MEGQFVSATLPACYTGRAPPEDRFPFAPPDLPLLPRAGRVLRCNSSAQGEALPQLPKLESQGR
jgi:hypothetical protein